MILWRGLQPILSRLVLDVLTLVGLTYGSLTPGQGWVLLASGVLTVATAGVTNRWTLTVPMVPLFLLQAVRRIKPVRSSKWAARTIDVLSMACILASAALSLFLFPALELPAVSGPYHVGVVDFFLPIEMTSNNGTTCHASCSSHVPVRLLYPTLEEPTTIPYLNPETSIEFCRQTMRFGAPPPLKEFGWMLHTWRLAGLRAKQNAELLPGQARLPVVIHSHGLGGTAAMYAYQTMSLAVHGYVVLALNHQDGSAPVVQRSDRSTVTYDYDILKHWTGGDHIQYVRARRSQADQRVQEFLAATEALHRLDESDDEDLFGTGLSFRGRLRTNHTFFMGHSFGGSTALTAAKRRPDLVKSVIAHEPAVDWMPDDARRSLFPSDRLEGLPYNFSGGTGGFEDYEANGNSGKNESIHDVDMLVLYSEEWREKKWGGSYILEDFYQLGRLGPRNGVSTYAVVKDARHNEFSDTCMLTPLWLARSVEVTGKRNPIDSAAEIGERTRVFLEAALSKDNCY